MGERPKLKLVLTITEFIIEIAGWILTFAIWALTLYNYQSLPDIIPTHYNGAGVADGFGNKGMILTLPLIATFIFIGLTILNKFPHTFNYPTEISKENALKQYKLATNLIRILKGIIVLIFGLISFQTINQAKGLTDGPGIWFLPLILGLIFTPIIFYLVRSARS